MADRKRLETGPVFPIYLVAGLVAMVVLAIIAWIALSWGFAVVILALAALLAGVAVFYRMLAGRGSEEHPQGGLPKLPADAGRPVGDTKEAHDEINPRDFPHDSVNRKPAEAIAGGEEGTTGGLDQGGAAGEGGPADDREPVSGEERSEGARP